MGNAKDDASTDVEYLTTRFAEDLTAFCADLRKARAERAKRDAETAARSGKKVDTAKQSVLPVISFSLDLHKGSQSRTPAEQAEQVVKNRSWVCWGAHMADKARHVVMRVDGKTQWDYRKAFGSDFEPFKRGWDELMRKHGLKNARGGDGWYEGDAFHVELPDSKIAKTDERIKACLEEYARLSRKQGWGKNEKFEKDYASMLKPYLNRYDTEGKANTDVLP